MLDAESAEVAIPVSVTPLSIDQFEPADVKSPSLSLHRIISLPLSCIHFLVPPP